jgi:hypothetical protein
VWWFCRKRKQGAEATRLLRRARPLFFFSAPLEAIFFYHVLRLQRRAVGDQHLAGFFC